MITMADIMCKNQVWNYMRKFQVRNCFVVSYVFCNRSIFIYMQYKTRGVMRAHMHARVSIRAHMHARVLCAHMHARVVCRICVVYAHMHARVVYAHMACSHSVRTHACSCSICTHACSRSIRAHACSHSIRAHACSHSIRAHAWSRSMHAQHVRACMFSRSMYTPFRWWRKQRYDKTENSLATLYRFMTDFRISAMHGRQHGGGGGGGYSRSHSSGDIPSFAKLTDSSPAKLKTMVHIYIFFMCMGGRVLCVLIKFRLKIFFCFVI